MPDVCWVPRGVCLSCVMELRAVCPGADTQVVSWGGWADSHVTPAGEAEAKLSEAVCCLKSAIRSMPIVQHLDKVFSLYLLNPVLLNVIAKCYGCLEVLLFFFDCTAIYMQQKKGSLPEILEDSLSWNVYTIYFLLEIGMSFERYVLLTLRVLA